MQRYRVNYVLLIALVVGFFATSGASYGLWRFQVDRNATRLLAKADAAQADGDVEEAYKSLDQYVRLRSKEPEARRRLGEAAIQVSDQEGLDMKTRGEAYQIAVDAVKRTDDAKLRRKLIDLQLSYNMFDVALQNIEELLDKGHGDEEVKALKAQCLFAVQKNNDGAKWCNRLIGYDEKSDTFDPAKAESPKKPVVYWLLSQYLYNNKQPELAKRVNEQMIAIIPDSRESQVFRYQFLKATNDNDAARAALEKAYELDPTDASVLAAKGSEAIADYQAAMFDAQSAEAAAPPEEAQKHLFEAGKFFNEALERYPDRIAFYEQCAKIELALKKPKEALAILEKGLAKFPMKTAVGASNAPLAIALFNLKMEVLLDQKDFTAFQQEIKKLRELNNVRVLPIADFNEARLAAINEKWSEAATRLAEIKSRLLGFSDLQAMASTVQGFCHMQMGQFDLALEAYKWALEKNPENPQAQMGVRQMEPMVNPNAPRDQGDVQLDQLIKEMLAKPKDQQDWQMVETKLDEYIDGQAQQRPQRENWAPSRKALLRGQILVARGAAETDEAAKKQLFTEARERIREASKLDPDDPQIQQQAIRLVAQEPGSGPEKALKLLDAIVAKGKDTASLRALKIDLLVAIHDEQLPSQLEAATQGMDEWPANQQALVWSTAAARFEQMGKFADAQRSLERTIELAPNNLPARMALFDLSLKQGDDAGMRRAQGRILEIVKRESDPGYVLTEVKRRLVGQSTGASTREELQEARTLLNNAIKQRGTFSDLYVASGQLSMVLENNPDQAMASFAKALELGATNLNAVAMQVRLLAERGKAQDARKTMERIPKESWAVVLDRAAADVLLAVGEADKAFAEAEKVAKTRSEDYQTQVWFADVANRAKKPETAEVALKKAVELNPAEPELWTRLVSLYLQLKRPADVERTLREAHLALDEEYLPLLTAKYYELQSRWQEAEDIYLTAYAERGAEILVARRLAEFYLTWATNNVPNRGKAAIYLNRILRAANEGKLPKGDPNGPWARRQAAKLLSMSNDYQDSLKAERLLSAAIEGGSATPDDEDQLIDILTFRKDPTSRERAVAMLRKIKQDRGLTAPRELLLGHILAELGEWDACKAQMEDAIGRYPDEADLKTGYTSLLINHKEFAPAQLWISRLDGVKGVEGGVQQLRLNLAAAKGNKEEVRSVLSKMVPNLTAMTEAQLKLIHDLALLADSVGDHEFALNLMREYARRAKGSELDLARLTALYGNLDEGLAMLKSQMETRMDDLMPVAVEVLRARRAEAPEKLDEEMSRIVSAGLRDDPESARRMIMSAEMLEAQDRFPESIEAYKKILARDDVPKLMRAAAANNLAFIVSLQGATAEDLDLALKYVNEATEIIGPISDILDTRALIYLAQSHAPEAVDDMKLSVKMNATASKFFHLAVAQLAAGNKDAALAAWARAEAEGIAPEKVNKLEREKLEEFKKKMESLRATPQL